MTEMQPKKKYSKPVLKKLPECHCDAYPEPHFHAGSDKQFIFKKGSIEPLPVSKP